MSENINNTPVTSEAETVGTEAIDPAPENAQSPGEQYLYSKTDTLVAWVSAFIGYLFCRLLPVADHPLGTVLFSVVLYAIAFAMLAVCKIKPNAMSVLSAVVGVLLSVGTFISDDVFISGVSSVFRLLAFVYFVYSATGNSLEKGLSNFLVADFLRALFIFPFSSVVEVFPAAFAHKNNSGWKLAGKILLGIALAVVPTTVIVFLLSYDADFSELIGNIFDFNVSKIFDHIGSAILGIPVAMYVFGLYFSGTKKTCEEALTADGFKTAGERCKVAAKSVVLAAVVPILFIYCVFFVSQWKYYVSAFTGALPEGFSYAQYAREGFFQLCTVAIINFCIIKLIALFMKRDGGNITLIQRMVSVLFAVSTLVLISTALAKMVMYINIYGLTRKRVYVSVFIIMIAIVFVLEVVRQFKPSFKSVPVSALVCVVLFLGLSLCDVNGFIMKYNVDRYLDGSLDTVDIIASYELGDSAVPELVRLAEHLDKKYGSDITKDGEIAADAKTKVMYSCLHRYLKKATEIYIDDGLFSQSVPALRAKRALRDIGYDEYIASKAEWRS
ncbi:MAG: DUF4173 domain-containing protein [Ruminococcaceae bacterium]|nr:DUF4173 domain-containing protein [Oscillospiraceae bacterium]